MKKPIKTSLSSEGKLPKLGGRDTGFCVDYINECIRYRFNREAIRDLADFVGDELAKQITAGLEEDCQALLVNEITSYRISETDKRYVYRLELTRDGSSLFKIKKLIRGLLQTSSELNNLSGSKLRRSHNRFEYIIDIDCSDGRFPTTGIPRLVRLLYALNEVHHLI